MAELAQPAALAEACRRVVLEGGPIKLECGGCVFLYSRPKLGVLRVEITGDDKGQFGTHTLDEIALALKRERPIELFVDAHRATGVAVSVSREWVRFLVANRSELARVHVLVGSKVVELTIAIAQHLSHTGNLMQIYSDPEIFESRLALSCGRG